MFVGAAHLLQADNDATFVGVDLCQTFSVTPVDLYYKWESIILAPNAIGRRYIDDNTHTNIRAVIQSDLTTRKAQGIKAESGLRRKKAALPVGMLGLGSRVNMKLSAVGLVDTATTLRPQFPTARSGGKVGTSKVSFECLDIEDAFQDKRNCTCHVVCARRPVSQ
jgi:hypothetical protein